MARRTAEMDDDLSETEDLEPLFDYHRVQHHVISLDDDDRSPASTPKRRKTTKTLVEKKVEVEKKEVAVVNCDDEEEDWLPPPQPQNWIGVQNQLGEDSTIRELRLKKQELLSVANSAENVLWTMDGALKRQVGSSIRASLETSLAAVAEEPSKPPRDRAKIVISVQDKDGLKQFRVYMV